MTVTSVDAVEGGAGEPFDLDAVYASQPKGKPFEFSYAGRRWTVPHIGNVDIRVLGQIENPADMTSADLETMFGYMFGAEQAAAWSQVPQPSDVIVALLRRWAEHSAAHPLQKPASRATGRKAAKAVPAASRARRKAS